jgi:deazaflavin-dependent oxidoreductase (nitroreductase family)
MTVAITTTQPTSPSAPRFGGLLWRIARATTGFARPFAGKRWNPIFAVVDLRGRKSGKTYATPVAARRIDRGFVIALAFGAQVDWYQNLLAAAGGTVRWRGVDHAVGAPERIGSNTALAAFNRVQRFALRVARIDGFVRVQDR